MVFLCSGSNIWDNRRSFLFGFFLESTVIKFLLVNEEIKRFSKKSKFDGEECLLLQDEHIIVFCVFTFRVDCEMYLCQKWKVPLSERRWTVCSSFKINTTSWVLHLFWLCTSHIDHDMFCFFLMARMTGAGWCYLSGTLSTLFGNAP